MIIAIPNASDDVTIPTAIPIPSPVIQQANNITYSLQHVMALYMWSQPNDTCGYSNDIQYVLPSKMSLNLSPLHLKHNISQPERLIHSHKRKVIHI